MDPVKFTMDLSSGGAANLRECVKKKLSEYIGNYTDDVLVDYVVVLVGHGKEKAQAVKDLEAFLGGDSEPFVSWLWDHMASNKRSYAKTEDDRPSDVVSVYENAQAQQSEPSLRSVVAVVEHGEETMAQMELEEHSERPGTVGAWKSDDIVTGEEVGRRRARRRDGLHRNNVKRSRSPEIWTRRGRGRGDRPDMKEMSPPVAKASRRLLINAVREVVNESALLATKKDALRKSESVKRLQSVVSSDADVQGNGGADVDMTHGDTPPVQLEPVDVDDDDVVRTVNLHERSMQEKLASVWDRISLNDRNRQNTYVAEGEFAGEVVDVESRGKWKKNAAAGHRAGSGKGGGGREPSSRGWVQNPGRKVGLNGHLFGDALRRVNSDQMQNQDSEFRMNGLHSKKQVGKPLRNYTSQVNEVVGEDNQPINEDVLEMKKRLRQVQLDMTKLRARQAEVTKEVQNSPAVGAKSIPFEPQPSQEDITARSVYVTNVHFAATQAALRVHFGRCGNINRVTLLVEPATGKPKGSAYVEFSSQDAMESALALNDTALLSRNLKVMRKNSAIAEMNPVPVLSNSFFQPPISRGYPTPHKLYSARRPVGLPMAHMGTSNLKWKRDASSSGPGTPSTVTPPADVDMIHTGPMRSSRSLSYVRVAPYATTQGSTGETQKT